MVGASVGIFPHGGDRHDPAVHRDTAVQTFQPRMGAQPVGQVYGVCSRWESGREGAGRGEEIKMLLDHGASFERKRGVQCGDVLYY